MNYQTLKAGDNRLQGDRYYAQVCIITPEFARFALDCLNSGNRKIKPVKLAQAQADMISGSFKFNGESIVFGKSGVLLDGQHRLTACVNTGISFLSTVSFGVPDEARDTIDIGAARTLGDTLTIGGMKNGNNVVAVARSIGAYIKSGGCSVASSHYLSNQELIRLIDDIPEICSSVSWAAKYQSSLKGICTCSHLATSRVILEPAFGNEAVYYLERVGRGDNIAVGDPAFTVRNRLMGARKQNSASVESIMRGAIAHVEGRKLARVQLDGTLPIIYKKGIPFARAFGSDAEP